MMVQLKKKFQLLYILGVSLLLNSCLQQNSVDTRAADPWGKLDSLLALIRVPVFAANDFNILDFGAVGNGATDNTAAIKKAIIACNKAGGGRVIVPPGEYFSGPIYLKSNVNFHLQKGAKILFSTDPKDYLPLVYTRWEGVELMNYSPLIYAYKEKNIAITGEGILDGQANRTNWWPWKGKKEYGWAEGMPNQTDAGKRDALFAMAEKDVPLEKRVFGEGFQLRPQFIQPYSCENVLIEGITIVNSPMWILHPVLCTNVTIQKVSVNSDGPNTDGCDPESCKNVLIKDCYFNTGDDCIAVKSGRNRDGRRINMPAENTIIQNCTMVNGHGGVVIGSEVSGGVTNLFAEDCKMSSPLLDRALRIKTSSARGGTTENIFLRNIEVGQVKQQAVIITMLYEDAGGYMPVVKNVEVKNMTVKDGGNVGILIEGYPQSPIENIRFINVNIDHTKIPYQFTHAKKIIFQDLKINGQKMKQDQIKVGNGATTPHW